LIFSLSLAVANNVFPFPPVAPETPAAGDDWFDSERRRAGWPRIFGPSELEREREFVGGRFSGQIVLVGSEADRAASRFGSGN
jgi:hypothetical protein